MRRTSGESFYNSESADSRLAGSCLEPWFCDNMSGNRIMPVKTPTLVMGATTIASRKCRRKHCKPLQQSCKSNLPDGLRQSRILKKACVGAIFALCAGAQVVSWCSRTHFLRYTDIPLFAFITRAVSVDTETNRHGTAKAKGAKCCPLCFQVDGSASATTEQQCTLARK